MLQAVKIETTNDANGNSRRGWDVFDGSTYIGFVAENGAGNHALRHALHLNNFGQITTLMTYKVTPGVYAAKLRGPQVMRKRDYMSNGMPIRQEIGKLQEIGKVSAGVWFEGAHGWHNHARVINLAWSFGMPYSTHDDAILDAYSDGKAEIKIGRGRDAEKIDTSDAILSQGGMLDAATEWLNAHIAPAGYYFAWMDGEYGLWEIEDDGDEDVYPVEVVGQVQL